MAERIVDLLEAVEVELDDSQAFAPPVRALDQRLEMIGQEGAVVQAGQAVMNRDEGHGIARIDQLTRLAQDRVGHRPEDEQRHQQDDAECGVEQRAVEGQQLFGALVGLGADTLAKGCIARQGGIGDRGIEVDALGAAFVAFIVDMVEL